MSLIEKMSIQGIRSFGPEDSNKQMITFLKPLTLILGPNGSGKTTIIECLRYMTTGDTPPSTDKGSAFVHDPKIANEIEVKGQVKLQLRDVSQKKVVVTRSMVATQKQKKISMKTLDGVIERAGASGERITFTSKCAELQNEMINLLGVSKAILNNVIFCHQEESNWPLSEGKAVKQRFDDIFAATRYIKALECIKKLRTEKLSDVRFYDIEVRHLRGNKEKAKELQEEVKNMNNRLAACNDKIKKVEEEMEPIQNKLADIAKKEDKLNLLASDLASKEGKLEQLIKSQKEIKTGIKEAFRGNLRELQYELNSLSTERSNKKALCEKLQEQSNMLQRQCRKLREKKEKLLEEVGNLKSELQRHQEEQSKCDELTVSLRELLGMRKLHKEHGKPLDEDIVKETARVLDEKLDDAHQQVKDMKVKWEEEEAMLQCAIDRLRDKKTKLEQSVEHRSNQITENNEEIREIIQNLRLADSMVTKEQDLKDNIIILEAKKKKIENGINVEELRSKICKYENERKNLEEEYNTLSAEISRLQKENSIRTEMELHMKDKKSKEEMINKLHERHKGTIAHLLSEVPKENIHNTLQKCLNTLNDEAQSLSRGMEVKNKRLTTLETTKKHILDQIKEKDIELEKSQRQIFEICGSQDLDEEISSFQASLKDLQDDKGAVTGSQYMFKKYVTSLQKPQPCCPLCTRKFDQAYEANELIQNLERKLQLIPSKLARMEETISEQQDRMTKMLEMRPVKQRMKNLKEKTLPELKDEAKRITDEIKTLKHEISEEDEIIEIKQLDQKMASSVQPDAVIWDQNLREISRLESKISTLEYQLGGQGTSQSIDQVSKKHEAVNKKMNTLKKIIESTQKEINDYMEQMMGLEKEMLRVKNEQFSISESLQQSSSLEKRQGHLSVENIELEKGVRTDKAEIKNLQKTLEGERKKKDELLQKKEENLETARNTSSTLERHKSNLHTYMARIRRFNQEGKGEALTQKQKNLDGLEFDFEEIENKLKDTASEKQKIEEELVAYELKKVDLERNKSYLEYKNSIREMEELVNKLKNDLGDLSATSVLSDKQKLGKKLNAFLNEREQSKGRQTELQRQICQRTNELNSDMFKDADKKYTDMVITLRTTELTCDDLNKYYIALSRAVMQYHTAKMKEINKIIRDLWRRTYTGNDIDYVEIRSDEQDDWISLETRKRTYNYRVVMVKDDVAIDMRGCCSAGQKVLASLIIRLALAETFCLNCGILALDEPTTNLDRSNIINLAEALKDIVKEREKQQNFQLIVITHDEDFIELLARNADVERYYKVYKDSSGFSRIGKCSLADAL